MTEHNDPSNVNNPFADPSANESVVDFEAGTILYVGRNASLSLEADALHVHGNNDLEIVLCSTDT